MASERSYINSDAAPKPECSSTPPPTLCPRERALFLSLFSNLIGRLVVKRVDMLY